MLELNVMHIHSIFIRHSSRILYACVCAGYSFAQVFNSCIWLDLTRVSPGNTFVWVVLPGAVYCFLECDIAHLIRKPHIPEILCQISD